MWLFKLKLMKIKSSVYQIHDPHFKRSTAACGQIQTLPSPQKAVSYGADLESRMPVCHCNLQSILCALPIPDNQDLNKGNSNQHCH